MKLSDESGQAIAEFVLVLFTLILVLFAILEAGLLLNAKRPCIGRQEIARVCAVEGGYVAKAMERVDSVIKSTGLEPDLIEATSSPRRPYTGATYT